MDFGGARVEKTVGNAFPCPKTHLSRIRPPSLWKQSIQESPLHYYKSGPLSSINYLRLWSENFSLASLTCETVKCLITIFKQYKSHQSAGWQMSSSKEEGISIYCSHFCLGKTNCNFFITELNDPTTHLHTLTLCLLELLKLYFLFFLAFLFQRSISVHLLKDVSCLVSRLSKPIQCILWSRAWFQWELPQCDVCKSSSKCCRVPKPEITEHSVSDQQWPHSGSRWCCSSSGCCLTPNPNKCIILAKQSKKRKDADKVAFLCSHYNR